MSSTKPLCEPFDLQDKIVAAIEAFYTFVINSQSENETTISFVSLTKHNVFMGDVLNITGVVDAEGELIEDYNSSFIVDSIVDDYTINVLKSQIFGNTITFNSEAIFTDSVTTTVRVHNDPGLDFDTTEYPIVIVDIDDTKALKTAGGIFIPDQTFFPITVMHRIAQFDAGDRINLRQCRYFVSYKMDEILDLLEIKVVSNVGRLETIWGSEEVSVAGTTLLK